MLGNAGLPPQAAFVTLPSGRWKRKDAESAPTCRSRVFVRRATAKAGDRYKKRGLCRRRVLRCAGSFFCASGPLEREEGVLLCRIEFGASAAAGVSGIVHRESAFAYSTAFWPGRCTVGRPAAVVNDRRAVLRLVLVRFFSALLGSVSVLFRNRLPRCGVAADRPAAFCWPCECPQHRGTRPLASRQTRTCGRRCMGFGNRSKIVVGVRGGRLFPSCPAARPPRRKAGNKARYGGLRVCASSAGVVSGGYLRHARSRSAFRKWESTSSRASDEIPRAICIFPLMKRRFFASACAVNALFLENRCSAP